jgi:hypothetical protein
MLSRKNVRKSANGLIGDFITLFFSTAHTKKHFWLTFRFSEVEPNGFSPQEMNQNFIFFDSKVFAFRKICFFLVFSVLHACHCAADVNHFFVRPKFEPLDWQNT